jgi:hypothetical protein
MTARSKRRRALRSAFSTGAPVACPKSSLARISHRSSSRGGGDWACIQGGATERPAGVLYGTSRSARRRNAVDKPIFASAAEDL